MLPPILKTVLPSIPLLKDAPGVRKSGADPSGLSAHTGCTPAPAQVSAYAEVCGFAASDTLPVTYPHVLAFPLLLRLLADPAYPFPALGSVHVSTTIATRRPIRVAERLDVSVRVSGLHTHPRGGLVDLTTEVRSGEEPVWESVSTYLGSGTPLPAPPLAATPDPDVPAGGRDWELPEDLGRRYAAVSGDRNPIHLFAWSARPFGFRRPIVHGMWSLAHCLATIERRLSEQTRVEVRFQRPLPLPSTVRFSTARASRGGPHVFALTAPADGRPYLVGSAT